MPGEEIGVLYSEIPGYKLDQDSRPTTHTAVFNFRLALLATLDSETDNSLEFIWPYGPDTPDPNFGVVVFGSYPITLQETDSSGTAVGPMYDVRDIIDNHDGMLSLEDLPAGGYGLGSPYKFFTLTVAVAEPSTFALLAMGAFVLLACAWRRQRRR